MKIRVADGVFRETLSVGSGLMVVRFTFQAGASVPPHQHDHEQSSYVVAGKLRYNIAGEEIELGPGDSLVVPSGTEHFATAIEETVDINCFSPIREDYL